MKWVRILVAVGFVGALVYCYFVPPPDFVRKLSEELLPVTKEEKEVRQVFTRYTDLLARGNPQSESIYMPNAAFQVVEADPHGDPQGRALTAAQHRTAVQQFLARIRAGQIRVRFADVQCRELPDGKVRLSCKEYVNGGAAELVSMVFVSTARQRWAVIEETHQRP